MFYDLGEAREPSDINNHGVVCGTGSRGAFVWSPAAGFIDIAPDGYHSWAYAINDAGQVAGSHQQEWTGPSRAFRWTPPATLELLDPLDMSSESSAALAIDSAGRCAGARADVGALWPTPGSFWDLPLQVAWAMNDYGQIVGDGYPDGPLLLWQPNSVGATAGTVHDVPGPPGFAGGLSVGRINASGQIAGTAWPAPNLSVPFLWTPDTDNGVTGSAMLLGTLPNPFASPDASNYAYGINRHGVVVGISNHYAFIYRHTMRNLNDFLPDHSGWLLEFATAINDNGWIVGTGYKDGAPNDNGFVLQTVPRLDRNPWRRQRPARPFPPSKWPPPWPPSMYASPRGPVSALLAHAVSPGIRDVMAALAASELARALRDDGDRARVQTAALEAAGRAIERMLLQHRKEGR